MPPMKQDLKYYESFLEIMADEINVKQIVIESPYEGLSVVYYHDTIKGGGHSEVVKNGKIIDAPKTRLILLESYFKQLASH
jgi:hypothetical protein